MLEDKTKKYVMLIRVILCFGVICFLAGFFIAASSTDNVFGGIAVMIFSVFISAVIAMIPTVKLIQLQKQAKENRIKKLEEEVEFLKKKL